MEEQERDLIGFVLIVIFELTFLLVVALDAHGVV